MEMTTTATPEREPTATAATERMATQHTPLMMN
jgi:hypothetical protein